MKADDEATERERSITAVVSLVLSGLGIIAPIAAFTLSPLLLVYVNWILLLSLCFGVAGLFTALANRRDEGSRPARTMTLVAVVIGAIAVAMAVVIWVASLVLRQVPLMSP